MDKNAKDYFEVLSDVVCKAVKNGHVPGGQYAALLVDEAHDFDEAWLRVAASMVDPTTNSLLVLYDDAQSIYQKKRRKFTFSSVGIKARGRTNVLKFNYRNTAEVLAVASDLAQSLLVEEREEDEEGIRRVAPVTAGRRGPMPVLIKAQNANEEAGLIAERVVEALSDGFALKDVAIICRTRQLMAPIVAALKERHIAVQSMHEQAFRRFDWNIESMKVLTMHSSKGLEFPLVIVSGLQALSAQGEEELEDEIRLLYVAMTRATRELVLSASGRSAVVDRITDTLVAVEKRFREQ